MGVDHLKLRTVGCGFGVSLFCLLVAIPLHLLAALVLGDGLLLFWDLWLAASILFLGFQAGRYYAGTHTALRASPPAGSVAS